MLRRQFPSCTTKKASSSFLHSTSSFLLLYSPFVTIITHRHHITSVASSSTNTSSSSSSRIPESLQALIPKTADRVRRDHSKLAAVGQPPPDKPTQLAREVEEIIFNLSCRASPELPRFVPLRELSRHLSEEQANELSKYHGGLRTLLQRQLTERCVLEKHYKTQEWRARFVAMKPQLIDLLEKVTPAILDAGLYRDIRDFGVVLCCVDKELREWCEKNHGNVARALYAGYRRYPNVPFILEKRKGDAAGFRIKLKPQHHAVKKALADAAARSKAAAAEFESIFGNSSNSKFKTGRNYHEFDPSLSTDNNFSPVTAGFREASSSSSSAGASAAAAAGFVPGGDGKLSSPHLLLHEQKIPETEQEKQELLNKLEQQLHDEKEYEEYKKLEASVFEATANRGSTPSSRITRPGDSIDRIRYLQKHFELKKKKKMNMAQNQQHEGQEESSQSFLQRKNDGDEENDHHQLVQQEQQKENEKENSKEESSTEKTPAEKLLDAQREKFKKLREGQLWESFNYNRQPQTKTKTDVPFLGPELSDLPEAPVFESKNMWTHLASGLSPQDEATLKREFEEFGATLDESGRRSHLMDLLMKKNDNDLEKVAADLASTIEQHHREQQGEQEQRQEQNEEEAKNSHSPITFNKEKVLEQVEKYWSNQGKGRLFDNLDEEKAVFRKYYAQPFASSAVASAAAGYSLGGVQLACGQGKKGIFMNASPQRGQLVDLRPELLCAYVPTFFVPVVEVVKLLEPEGYTYEHFDSYFLRNSKNYQVIELGGAVEGESELSRVLSSSSNDHHDRNENATDNHKTSKDDDNNNNVANSSSSSSSKYRHLRRKFIRMTGTNASYDMTQCWTIAAQRECFKPFQPDPKVAMEFLKIIQQHTPRPGTWIELRRLLHLAGEELQSKLPQYYQWSQDLLVGRRNTSTNRSISDIDDTTVEEENTSEVSSTSSTSSATAIFPLSQSESEVNTVFEQLAPLLFFSQFQHLFSFSIGDGGLIAGLAPGAQTNLDQATTPCPAALNHLIEITHNQSVHVDVLEKHLIPQAVLDELRSMFPSWEAFAHAHRGCLFFNPKTGYMSKKSHLERELIKSTASIDEQIEWAIKQGRAPKEINSLRRKRALIDAPDHPLASAQGFADYLYSLLPNEGFETLARFKRMIPDEAKDFLPRKGLFAVISRYPNHFRIFDLPLSKIDDYFPGMRRSIEGAAASSRAGSIDHVPCVCRSCHALPEEAVTERNFSERDLIKFLVKFFVRNQHYSNGTGVLVDMLLKRIPASSRIELNNAETFVKFLKRLPEHWVLISAYTDNYEIRLVKIPLESEIHAKYSSLSLADASIYHY